jgi:GDP-L-fucose synthase
MARIFLFGDTGFLGRSFISFNSGKHQVFRSSDYFIGHRYSLQDILNVFLKLEPEIVLFFSGQRLSFGRSPEEVFENYQTNSAAQAKAIAASEQYGKAKFFYASSSAIYDGITSDDLTEDIVMNSEINYPHGYQRSKYEGMKECLSRFQSTGNFVTLIISNVYGPLDFHSKGEPTFVKKLVMDMTSLDYSIGKDILFQGNKHTARDFLYVDDFSESIDLLVESPNLSPIYNIGSGSLITVSQLSEVAANIVKFQGEVIFQSPILETASRRLMNLSRITNLGWRAKTLPILGLQKVIDYYTSMQH